jgi:Cof subfamily protein (haloacid dehalogenase superfamily)
VKPYVRRITTLKDPFILPEFRKRPDAIALDLDGTLLNSQGLLSERNSRAINGCLQRSIPIVIATSRPARSVRRLIGAELMDLCSLVMQNGAIGIGVTPLSGKIKETIPVELVRKIIDTILKIEPEMRITLELEGYRFGTNKPREPASLWEVNSATPDMQLPLEAVLDDGPTKIAAGGLNRDISHVANEISKRFKDVISVVPTNDMTFLNLTSKTATKPDTLRRLLAARQIPMNNVIAFGDDIPDIGLLSACGIPVAVANAFPPVKSAARYCTASNDEDGVAIVLEKILEI